MLKILGQMDTATQIFEYLYLGSEWNASNLEELKLKGFVALLSLIFFHSSSLVPSTILSLLDSHH